jgi:hypothetical protein
MCVMILTATSSEILLILRRIKIDVITNAPRSYPYFDVVVGLVWSHDPKSYASGSVCYW